MGDHSKLIHRIKSRYSVNNMEDAVGKGKKLLVFPSGETVFLLVPVCGNLCASNIMSAHIFTYFSPMFLFTIGEVDCFQALKGIVYDGDGRQKRKGTSGKEIENDKVYAPVVICGQETPQRDDNALMSRIIVCFSARKCCITSGRS